MASCCGDCPAHYRMFGSIPGLYPLDTEAPFLPQVEKIKMSSHMPDFFEGGLNHHHFRSSASQQPCLIELYAMREMPNIVATSHMWVLSTCKVASTTEDMTVKYYFILVNLIAKATKNQWPLYFLYIFIGFRYDSRQ